MRQIVYNSVTCLECLKTLVSYHRHDCKMCSCKNQAMVDGGTDYLRYSAKDMRKISLHTVYADEDFSKVRKYASRGSRGKDGKQPLSHIPICDMEDDHLEAVLDYGGADWHLDLIRKEIEYRSNKKKTAVDFLFDKLWDMPKDKMNWYAVKKIAKEMEKEQIKDAYTHDRALLQITAEHYYSETFK